jgi:hypothetical protein
MDYRESDNPFFISGFHLLRQATGVPPATVTPKFPAVCRARGNQISFRFSGNPDQH